MASFETDPMWVAIRKFASMEMTIDEACPDEQTVNEMTICHSQALERSFCKADILECAPLKKVVGHGGNSIGFKEDVL